MKNEHKTINLRAFLSRTADLIDNISDLIISFLLILGVCILQLSDSDWFPSWIKFLVYLVISIVLTIAVLKLFRLAIGSLKKKKWRNLLLPILDTKRFRRLYRREISNHRNTIVKERLEKFCSLQIIAPSIKEDLLYHIRYHEKRLAYVDAAFKTIKNDLNSLIVITLFPLFMAFPIAKSLTKFLFNIKDSSSFEVDANILIPFLLVSFFPFLVFGWVNFSRGWKLENSWKAIIACLSFPVTMFAIIIYRSVSIIRKGYPLDELSYSLTEATVLIILFIILFILFSVLPSSFLEHSFQGQKKALYPDSLIVSWLVDTLVLVEIRSTDWTDVTIRKQILSNLEKLAVLIQHDLSRTLPSGDIATDLWQRESAAQKAAAVRSLKKWVCHPKADTREQLIKRLSNDLVHVATGNWDALERIAPEKGVQLWRNWIIFMSRLLFKASLPLLLLWIFQQTPLALKGDPAQFVTIGVFILAALTLLMELDPNFGSRIATLKDITQLLSVPGRDRKN
ncbi:MAG TPA: hypothetical protein V6C78_09975 [Crinalium sp.]